MSEPIVRKVLPQHPDTKKHSEDIARTVNLLCDQINQGVILESPDGSRFRLTVDNAGTLSTTAL